MQGVKINSPHYLVRLDLPAGDYNLTLVVSQYEKSTTIRYSIKVELRNRARLPFMTLFADVLHRAIQAADDSASVPALARSQAHIGGKLIA